MPSDKLILTDNPATHIDVHFALTHENIVQHKNAHN